MRRSISSSLGRVRFKENFLQTEAFAGEKSAEIVNLLSLVDRRPRGERSKTLLLT